MQPLVTCLQDKLSGVYFTFKKIDRLIYIYEETWKTFDERFWSENAEAVRLTKKIDNEKN